MSDDTREDLLVRLTAIMQTVPGIVSGVRNRGLRKNEDRPAMILLDGDEFPRLSVDTRRLKGRAGLMAPQIVSLRPEVYILLQESRPNTEQVGQELNALRIAYLKLVWNDADIGTILGSNGSLIYNGCATDLKSGSALSGQMRLDFLANYVLRPPTT